MGHLRVNKWSPEDRPTEKAERIGYEGLSNAELLAILIGSGTEKMNAVELSRTLLASCDNKLSVLAKKDVSSISFSGLGRRKISRVMAALELGKRRYEERMTESPDLATATRIYNHMHPVMCDLEHEEFWIIMMNQNYRLIKKERISLGGITETSVDIRIIMRECVLNNATILAVCHNHPSGNLSPSKCDDDITKVIKNACSTMRIHFLDHVIVTDGAYYSYHEEGRI